MYWYRTGWLSNGVLRGDPAHGGRSGWMLVVNWMVVYLLLRKRVFCCGGTPPEVNEKLANRKRNGGGGSTAGAEEGLEINNVEL